MNTFGNTFRISIFGESHGKWVGITGPIADRHFTMGDARIAHRTGAGQGIYGRHLIAIDIDEDDPAIADAIADHVQLLCGKAPARGRDGSGRRVLIFRGTGHRKRRMAYRSPDSKEGDKDHAIELIGEKFYYNLDGMHPSGTFYSWDQHPTGLPFEAIPTMTTAEAEVLWQTLPARGKYPPAEPGALEMGPLEAAVGVADVVRHEVTLFDPAFLLQPQLANTSPKDCPSLGRAPSCGTWE